MVIEIKDFMTKDLGLKGNELLLYAIIYQFDNKLNIPCSMSIKDIAKLVNSSERSMYRALDKLKEKGIISRGYYSRNSSLIK